MNKTLHTSRRTTSRDTRRPRGKRQGSTLVVVLALLALLSVLGLAFVTLAGSERTSAENYSAAAEREFQARPKPSTRVLTRFSLDRVLAGARTTERNSALSGGRHTLLANLFGRDIQPHSGRGVNVIGYTIGGQQTGYPVIDQDYNGTPDSSQTLIEINDSPSANNGSMPTRPDPDIDYTAPDLNNAFLAFNSFALDPYGRPVHVVIPSFARPQYIRSITSGATKAVPVLDWETRSGTAKRVLRPHPMHKDYGPNGNLRVSALDPNGLRYVVTKAEANRLGLSGPFPFGHTEDTNGNGQLDAGEDRNDNGFLDTEAHHGVWTLGAWQQNTYYRSGQWIIFSEDANGNNVFDPGEDTIVPGNSTIDRWYFRCETAGTSGNSRPTFGAVNIGSTTSSGGGAPLWRRYSTFQARYEFDADADGDGVREAVWLDLDFPIQSLGNGKKAIPLFALTIYDADGLMNLNTAGNTSGPVNLGGGVFGGGQFISKSNLGMSPSEVNPLWGLDAGAHASDFPTGSRTTAEVFQDQRSFFGHVPSDWIESANMEWWFLLKGRPVREPGSGSLLAYIDGRHGEVAQLAAAIAGNSTTLTDYPQPGGRGIDDNFNSDEGELAPPFDINRLAAARSYGHPLDFRGTGTSTVKVGSLFQPQCLTLNRTKFLQYTGYQAQQVPMTGGTTVRWGQALSGGLMQQSITTGLIDEQSESIVDERHRPSTDRLFDSKENYFLHASRSDLDASGFESRLARLGSYNFRTNTRSEKIRRRFTVDSWDTRDYVKTFPGVITATDARRRWEFWSNGGSTFSFPPRFTGSAIGTTEDPFRVVTRELLELVANRAPSTPTDSRQLQRQLSSNHLLEKRNGTVQYRPLTEHPVNPGTNIVPINWTRTNLPAYPPTNLTQQEFWARYDRQRMARDIYVLLYTLCGGSDLHDYTTTNDHDDTLTPGDNADLLYTTEQLREMAQFAVNFVDAMDSDNVVTRFEYDKNLGPTVNASGMMLRAGWNVDDNAWTDEGFTPITSGASGYDADHPLDSVERGVVHGVEAQQLTISEFIAARTTQVTDPDAGNVAYNHPATAHDDTLPRTFAGIELRNISPFDVSMADGAYRIEIRPTGSSPAPGDIRRVTFRSPKQIEAATALSVISCADDALSQNNNYSVLSVDPDYAPGVTTNPNFLQVFPRTLVPADVIDLCRDAAPTATMSPFRISNGNGTDLTPTVGSLLTGSHFTTGGLSVQVILQRRMHPDRATFDPITAGPGQVAAYDLDNPWIEIDRMVYTRTAAQMAFDIEKKDNDATATETHNIRKQLWELRSRQRPQPFHRSGEAYMPNPTGTIGAEPWRTIARANLVLNSVGADNSNSPTTFDRWQPHFDRPFTSLVDLFDIPVYAPHDTTSLLDTPGTYSAGQFKFLRPDFPNATSADPRFDNRWTRLLNFVEVPTRTDRFPNATLPPSRKYRVPGRININTMRHPETLGGLIDRSDVCTVQPTLPNSHLPDATGETSRDWWSQLIVSRDGYDPVSELFLPGMAHGRPFRSLGLTRFGVGGIERTLLRSIPLDGNTTSGYVRRRLFQLGTQSQHNNQSVHHHTRHRILAKILGNTTTRSNVFFVFMKVDWFECHQDAAQGHVRIGAKLESADSQRSFYVIDRSRALELLQGNHIPSNGTYTVGQGNHAGTSGIGTGNSVRELDSGPMILFQQVIE